MVKYKTFYFRVRVGVRVRLRVGVCVLIVCDAKGGPEPEQRFPKREHVIAKLH